NVFCIYGIEHLVVDCLENNERRGHVPVGNDHTKICAMLANQYIENVLRAFRVEARRKPIARLTHCLLATQLIQFKNAHHALVRRTHPRTPFERADKGKQRLKQKTPLCRNVAAALQPSAYEALSNSHTCRVVNSSLKTI